jgi:hypothetical protein
VPLLYRLLCFCIFYSGDDGLQQAEVMFLNRFTYCLRALKVFDGYHVEEQPAKKEACLAMRVQCRRLREFEGTLLCVSSSSARIHIGQREGLSYQGPGGVASNSTLEYYSD